MGKVLSCKRTEATEIIWNWEYDAPQWLVNSAYLTEFNSHI